MQYPQMFARKTQTAKQAAAPGSVLKRAAAFFAALSVVLFTHAPAIAEESTPGFETVKANSTPQTFSLDSGGTLTVWAATLEVDSLSKSKKVMIYAKLGMPYSAQDVGAEKFDSKFILPDSDNWLKYNDYARDSLEWAPEDTASQYDKTIFRIGSPIQVRGDSVQLQLKVGGPFTVKISDLPKKLDTHELEEAISEHERDYGSAVSRGLKLEEKSDKAYKEQLQKAKDLLEKAKSDPSGITQEDLAQMRTALNEKFSAITPLPFDRSALNTLLEKTDKLLAENGKNGKRFTKAGYEALTQAAAQGANLVAKKDPTGILVPHEGSEITTHGDFTAAETQLKTAIDALQTEDYTAPNTDALKKAFDEAVVKTPAKGKTWTDATRKAFIAAVHKTQNKIPQGFAYDTQQDVDALTAEITGAQGALQETALDPAKKVTVKFTYVHPTENGPTELITEPFKAENGQPVEQTREFAQDEEVRIPFTDELIKKFPGYRPEVFSLNSEDGSQPLAQVLRDREGRHTLAFKASAAGAQKVVSLQIKYVKGTAQAEPGPKPPTPPTPPAPPAPHAGNALLTVTDTEAVPGGRLAFTLTGLEPNEKVTAAIYSKVVTLPEMKADATGKLSATWNVPADFAPGTHTLKVTAEKSGTFTKTFTVKAAQQPGSGSDAHADSAPAARITAAGLEKTGACAALLPILALFSLGTGMIFARRRENS